MDKSQQVDRLEDKEAVPRVYLVVGPVERHDSENPLCCQNRNGGCTDNPGIDVDHAADIALFHHVSDIFIILGMFS